MPLGRISPLIIGRAKVLLAITLWGCSFIALHVVLGSATPAGVVWLRNALAALVLLLILRAQGRDVLPQREDRRRVLLLGLLLSVHYLIQSQAMRSSSAMQAGWIMAFIPAVVAAGAGIFLRQRLHLLGWAGIAVATAGVLLLSGWGGHRPMRLSGDPLLFLSTFTWAAYTLLCVAPSQRSGGLVVSAGAFAVSVFPALGLALVKGTWHAAPAPEAIGAILFLGVGAGAVALWCFSDAVALMGAARTSAFQYLQPLVTVLASFAMLAEPMNIHQLLAGMIVLMGVWLVQRGKAKAAAATA